MKCAQGCCRRGGSLKGCALEWKRGDGGPSLQMSVLLWFPVYDLHDKFE